MWHANPPDTGWSRSGWIATTVSDSSTSATSGHSGSQIRQNVDTRVVLDIVPPRGRPPGPLVENVYIVSAVDASSTARAGGP